MGPSTSTMKSVAASQKVAVRFCASLARNGQPATEYASSSKAVLEQLPRGAYTTARTFRKYSVFELDTHVNRMAQTCRLLADDDPSLPTDLSDPAMLSPLVQLSMASAITGFEQLFRNAAPVADEEYKLTIRGSPRENALAKDSNWTSERKPLEQLMASDCEELILADPAGGLPEGSQTNFYAIDAQTGDLITAGEGVLEGTVRRVVLDVCAAEGINIRLESPSIQQARDGGWAGAAVSSTSRLFLPAHLVTLPEEGATVEQSGGEQQCQVFDAATADGPFSSRCEELAEKVQQQVAQHSTQLPGLC